MDEVFGIRRAPSAVNAPTGYSSSVNGIWPPSSPSTPVTTISTVHTDHSNSDHRIRRRRSSTWTMPESNDAPSSADWSTNTRRQR